MRNDKLREAFEQTRALIQEAKAAEGPKGGSITDNLDFAEHWLNQAEDLAFGVISTTNAPVADLREALARIISPEWFGEESGKHVLDNRPGQHLEYQARAFAKADQICALLSKDNSDANG